MIRRLCRSVAIVATVMVGYCEANTAAQSQGGWSPDGQRPVVSDVERRAIVNSPEGLEGWEIVEVAGRPNENHPYFAALKVAKLVWARTPPFVLGEEYASLYGFRYRVMESLTGLFGQRVYRAEISESAGWPEKGAVIWLRGTPQLPVVVSPDEVF